MAHFEPLLALLLQNKAYCRATQFWLVSELGVWEARAGVSAHGLMKQGRSGGIGGAGFWRRCWIGQDLDLDLDLVMVLNWR